MPWSGRRKLCLSALGELDSSISEKYDPLIEEVEKVKVEESELKEPCSAVQEEESPLLFLEKLDGLQLRLQALGKKQLPEPGPVEIHPRMEKVLQDTRAKAELREVHRIHTPKLRLAPRSQGLAEQLPAALWALGTEIQATLTDPKVRLSIPITLVVLSLKDLLAGATPAPLVQLWKFLQWIYADFCTSLQDRVQELRFTSALPLQLCRRIFPDYFDWTENT